MWRQRGEGIPGKRNSDSRGGALELRGGCPELPAFLRGRNVREGQVLG